MLALPVINHLIQQNPEIRAELSGYNGIVLTLITAGMRIHGRFNEHGFLEETERAADTILTFHNSVWQKMLQGEMPNVGDFDIRRYGIGFSFAASAGWVALSCA